MQEATTPHSGRQEEGATPSSSSPQGDATDSNSSLEAPAPPPARPRTPRASRRPRSIPVRSDSAIGRVLYYYMRRQQPCDLLGNQSDAELETRDSEDESAFLESQVTFPEYDRTESAAPRTALRPTSAFGGAASRASQLTREQCRSDVSSQKWKSLFDATNSSATLEGKRSSKPEANLPRFRHVASAVLTGSRLSRQSRAVCSAGHVRYAVLLKDDVTDRWVRRTQLRSAFDVRLREHWALARVPGGAAALTSDSV